MFFSKILLGTNSFALFITYRSIRDEVDFHSCLHAVINFFITMLGAYHQLQYQSQKKSPLEEHGIVNVTIYVNLFLYAMGFMVESMLKTCYASTCLWIIKTFTILFGILFIGLIMIILYPILGFKKSC